MRDMCARGDWGAAQQTSATYTPRVSIRDGREAFDTKIPRHRRGSRGRDLKLKQHHLRWLEGCFVGYPRALRCIAEEHAMRAWRADRREVGVVGIVFCRECDTDRRRRDVQAGHDEANPFHSVRRRVVRLLRWTVVQLERDSCAPRACGCGSGS